MKRVRILGHISRRGGRQKGNDIKSVLPLHRSLGQRAIGLAPNSWVVPKSWGYGQYYTNISVIFVRQIFINQPLPIFI